MFEVHKLNDDGMRKAAALAKTFAALERELQNLCAQSRELSIARTHLETACFYAKRAVAIDPDNHTDVVEP